MPHTPGPWTMASEPYEDGTPYCRIKAGNPFLSNEEMGFELSAIMRPADALLIAAAPQMLAALEALVEEWEPEDSDPFWDEARAAIKAAKGE